VNISIAIAGRDESIAASRQTTTVHLVPSTRAEERRLMK
jgi:hypothetical protein